MFVLNVKNSEWLLSRRCNLSNIGGCVYVRVGVDVRVIFSITWPARTRSRTLDRISVVTIATALKCCCCYCES